jgi:O-antigen ligase
VIEFFVTVYAIATLIMLVVKFEIGLLLLLPLLPLVMYTYRTPVTGLNTNNLLIYTAFAMSLMRAMGSGRKGLPPVTLPLVVFFGATLIAWFVGILNFRGQGYDAVRVLINMERWLLYTLLYFAYFYGWSGQFSVYTAARWMLAGLMIVTGYTLIELAHPSEYLRITGRAGGVFAQANANGVFLASFAFLPVALAEVEKRTSWRWIYLAGFGACVAAQLMSASRSAFLCFLAGGLAYTFYRSRRAFAIAFLGLCILVPFYKIVLPETLAARFEATRGRSSYEGVAGHLEMSAANRAVQYKIGMQLFLESPVIGHGIDGFHYRSKKYLPPDAPMVARAVHTTFIKVLTEAGIIGIGCFFWLLLSLGWQGIRLYRSSAGEHHRFLGLFLITIVFAKVVANLFHTEFLTGDVTSYLWVTAGLVSWLNLRLPERRKAEVQEPVRSAWRPREPRPTATGATHG